jgi:uncharacterized protein (TIGR02145 family)
MKQMRKITSILFAMLLIVTLAACSKDDKPVRVRSVTLDETTLELHATETAPRLIVTFEPSDATNRSITWTSNNIDVATVAGGRVTGVAVGTATITATSADGSHTATCFIRVVPTSVTGVRLRSTITILEGEKETLVATIFPSSATNKKVTWESSSPSIATIDADTGEIRGVEAGGTAIITVETDDGLHTASSTVYVVSPTFDYGINIGITRWATRNVDKPGTFASKPENVGLFYQWNKDESGWEADWNGNNATTWQSENDPCPAGWRMPTEEELISLRTSGSTWSANWESTGINGRVFGNADNPIFLPAAGFLNFNNGAVSNVGTQGYYWSATTNPVGNVRPTFFNITGSTADIGSSYRANGFSIRCVAE